MKFDKLTDVCMTWGIRHNPSHTNVCKFVIFNLHFLSRYIAPDMLKLCRVAEVKVLFLVLVYVFNFNLFEFSAAILEKGLFFILTLVLCLCDYGTKMTQK